MTDGMPQPAEVAGRGRHPVRIVPGKGGAMEIGVLGTEMVGEAMVA
jgi:hypothetical protein